MSQKQDCKTETFSFFSCIDNAIAGFSVERSQLSDLYHPITSTTCSILVSASWFHG